MKVTLPDYQTVVEEEVSLVRQLHQQAPRVRWVIRSKPYCELSLKRISAGWLHLNSNDLAEDVALISFIILQCQRHTLLSSQQRSRWVLEITTLVLTTTLDSKAYVQQQQ
mmetsp:Transcript_16962/g.36522  ORF Transcript_16962/g.36522 Transcript_16962/m.36522 type:complete len:110 (-) Transcript_16962:138-467(-)